MLSPVKCVVGEMADVTPAIRGRCRSGEAAHFRPASHPCANRQMRDRLAHPPKRSIRNEETLRDGLSRSQVSLTHAASTLPCYGHRDPVLRGGFETYNEPSSRNAKVN